MNRTIIITIILILCFLDLVATYYYIHTYKKWQPEKPYKEIELNPLLRFLWDNFGFHLGMLIGAVLLLALNYIVSKEAHWAIVVLLGAFLCWAMFNHFTNINLLHDLIEKYPSGHLPTSVFGNVVGNN